MIKKNFKKEINNFGVVNLGEIALVDDTLDVFIPVESFSVELQKRIDAEVEKVKAYRLAELKKYMPEKAVTKWCDKGVDVIYKNLHIVVKKKMFTYSLNYDFVDKENEYLWADVVINVDLSAYEQELKKMIVKAVIDKFF